MAEPVSTALGIASSIVTLIETTKWLVVYGLDFAEAPRAIQELKASLGNLTSLLERLRVHCENTPVNAPWLQGLYQVQIVEKDGKSTVEIRGVLGELQQTIEKISIKLNPSKKWKQSEMWQRPMWHFLKESIKESQADIQRYLGVITAILTLKNDETSTEILRIQKEDIEKRNTENDRSERMEIIRWLSPLSFLAKERELYAECFQETGKWLLQDQVFDFWAEGDHQFYLQCIGEPMVGKTVLSSILSHHLRSRTDKPPLILSVYLDYKAATVQTLSNIMKSLLKQIIQIEELRPISDELKALYRNVKLLELTPASYDHEIRKILVSELDRHSCFYIVVDALDELQPRDRIRLRKELRGLLPTKSNLVFMSRPIEGDVEIPGTIDCDRCGRQDIKIFYKCQVCNNGDYDLCLTCKRQGLGCNDTSHTLSMPYGRREIEVKIPREDIEQYVRREIGLEMSDANPVLVDERSAGQDKIDMSRFQSLCQKDPKLPRQIVDTIVDKSSGRFLFARLYLDLLKTAKTPIGLKRILESFPEETNEIYRESMRRIEKQKDKDDRAKAFRILGVISRARRPLSMKALQHALAVMELGEDDEDFTEPDILNALMDVNVILEITSGLIITQQTDYGVEVKLVHRTLEDHLQEDESRHKWFSTIDLEIARGCLQYLSVAVPRETCKDEYWVSRNNEYPFLYYASEFWGDHVREALSFLGPNSLLEEQAIRLIEDSKYLSACLHAAWFTNKGGQDSWDVRKHVDSLHVCAWYGLSFAITTLEPERSMVDIIEPKYGQTALMYSCRKGHPETVRQLLALGASLRKVSGRGRTAMFEAVLHRQEEVVEVLVELMPPDLDINAVDPKQYRRTALMIAVKLDCLEIINMLLNYPGIKLDLQDVNGMTALYLAAKYDHQQAVDLLLEAGANTEIGDFKVGRTALRVAAERDHLEIVENLLQHGAQIDLEDRSRATALMHAVRRGAERSLKKLIAAGGDIQTVDENGQSLLHCACGKDLSRIARILIDDGLDPNLRDKSKRTPSHIASQYGKATVLSLLLEKGADITLKDQYDRTAKCIAWQYGHIKVVDLLERFEHGHLAREPEPLPYKSQLPIWSMAKRGLAELLIQVIKERENDIVLVEPFVENTTLHCAIEAQEPDILLFLLETKAGAALIDNPNRWGRTPLHLAALTGDSNAVELLLSRDASLDPKDRWGDEPLVLASSNWHWDVMLALIVAGASIDKQKIDLEKLFFVAVEKGDVAAVQNLLNEGVDRSVENAEGLRALHIATATGDEAMKQVLLRAPTVVFGAAGPDINGNRTQTGSTAASAEATSFVPFRSRPIQSRR